jgi:hypothetical protein
MNKYTVFIEDIFNKNINKSYNINEINVYAAHKQGLKNTNALREEISKIIRDEKIVYTFKNGFCEE